MSFFLCGGAQTQGYRLHVYDCVDSTQSVAFEKAYSGDPGFLWIVAKKQEAGRGCCGRIWQTPEDNLSATLLLVFDKPQFSSAMLGFVAGFALMEALDFLRQEKKLHKDQTRFQLKWPNDVLGQGAKIAGILVETALTDKDRMAVALGIGVNILNFPEGLAYPAGSLKSLGMRCNPERLFFLLSKNWIKAKRIWNNGKGKHHIRDLWLSYAPNEGEKVRVRVHNKIQEGFFQTIDQDYRCVIRGKDESRIILSSGELNLTDFLNGDDV